MFVLRRMGGSCAQAEKPEIQEPGRPEGLPRTAAMTREDGHKNAPAIVGGRLCACILPGSQARSLILQRQGETRFVAGAGQPLKRRCLCPGPNHPTPPTTPLQTPLYPSSQRSLRLAFQASKRTPPYKEAFQPCRNIAWHFYNRSLSLLVVRLPRRRRRVFAALFGIGRFRQASRREHVGRIVSIAMKHFSLLLKQQTAPDDRRLFCRRDFRWQRLLCGHVGRLWFRRGSLILGGVYVIYRHVLQCAI
ncbi:hypothetical protein C4K25_3984 [Pseudomonas chlororaphis]|nr:hypothetical protein C4K25_3984 [Pseudomonas chlororaphis]